LIASLNSDLCVHKCPPLQHADIYLVRYEKLFSNEDSSLSFLTLQPLLLFALGCGCFYTPANPQHHGPAGWTPAHKNP
jgi:hypothetical protein